MKKIGIFYGSSTGMTAEVAEEIAKAMGVDTSDIHNVADSAPSDVEPYDVLIFGSSTWGSGELQDDWLDMVDGLEATDLSGKKIALFGCGDESMSDTFCGALGELYTPLLPTGAKFIGHFNADGYDFESTEAFQDGIYVGLMLDNVNKEDLTAERIKAWTNQLKKEIA